ncbi:MAG: response regulator [Candidatus Paceibacterota bacterium]|jgi:CheY-like chemotaxis protein
MDKQKNLVLIVDDEEDYRKIVKAQLEAASFKVVEAKDGVDALKILDATPEPIAVVVMDVAMPNMNGIETLFKIKENNKTRNIRVIMLTGKGDPREEITKMNKKFAQESGAFDYIRKESDINVLIDRVNKIMTENGENAT